MCLLPIESYLRCNQFFHKLLFFFFLLEKCNIRSSHCSSGTFILKCEWAGTGWSWWMEGPGRICVQRGRRESKKERRAEAPPRRRSHTVAHLVSLASTHRHRARGRLLPARRQLAASVPGNFRLRLHTLVRPHVHARDVSRPCVRPADVQRALWWKCVKRKVAAVLLSPGGADVSLQPGGTMAEPRVSRWYFGGLASCGAACCTHPLDLVKVRD